MDYTIPAHLQSRMVAVDTQRFRVMNHEMGAHLLRYTAPDNPQQEDLKIIKKMADFMQLNADNGRFAQWGAKTTSPHHAGYFREVDYGRSTQYWIVPAIFEQEIFQGIDVQKVCQVLCDLGWLIRAEQDRWKHKKRDKGRFYVLNGLEAPEK